VLGTNCRKIVGGSARGKAMVTKQAINFLAMVDVTKGVIKDKNHELFEKSINGLILVLPNAIGSSVGAYTIYSLRLNGTSPIAVVCTNNADITLSSGCAISNIPLVDKLDEMIASNLRSGLTISVDSDQEKVSIQTV
jgi:phosphomecalonate degydratase small subunit